MLEKRVNKKNMNHISRTPNKSHKDIKQWSIIKPVKYELQHLFWCLCLFVWFDSLRPINNISVSSQALYDWATALQCFGVNMQSSNKIYLLLSC